MSLVILVRGGTGAGPPPQDVRAAQAVASPPAPARGGRLRRAAVVTALAAATALGVTAVARSFDGQISTVAGSATAGFSGNGGPATSASLDHAVGVAVTGDGVLFIADSVNDRIRRVGTDGTITNVAGSGVVGWSGDGGPATAAGLNTPRDVAIDLDGDVYVADTYNDVVRRIDTDGVISTVAGTGSSGWTGDDGPATSLKLSAPEGVAVEADGDLLIADTGNHRIRRVDGAGQMTTVAGNGAGSYGGDGGSATSAQVRAPADVAPYPAGGFVIADTGNHRVRSVSASGTISTLAGTGTAGFGGDGGSAVNAQFRSPAGVSVSGSGSVYVADRDNHRLRRIATSGSISTSVGTGTAGFSGDGGSALFARINTPQRLASGPDGLYFADSANSRIRFVEGSGASVVAPTVSAVSPSGPANDNAPEVSGTAPAGTTVRVYTNASCSSAVAATGTADAFASPGLTVSVPDDGTTTFHAKATAASGTSSACSPTSVSYTEDSTPPGTATISGAPASSSTDTTPTWTFSGPGGGATLECRFDGPSGQIQDWAACSTSSTPTVATDGSYTFSVRARDAAGNTSAAATSTYTLDRVPPPLATIATGPGAETNDATPTFTFTGEADATFSCRMWRGATPLADWAACPTPYTPDISAQLDGAFTLRVRAVDAAQNIGPEAETTFTLDRVAPGTSSFTGGTGPVGSDPDPAWTFSTPSGASAECRLDLGATQIADWGACTSPVTYPLTDEDDGTYTVSVRSRDAAGNRSAADTRTYRFDTSKPAAPSITSGPPAVGAGTSPTWTFTAEGGADVECRVVGAVEVSGWTDCASPHTVALGGEPDGTYTLSIRATDDALNTSDETAATYTLDRGAPEITASPPSIGNDPTPTWAFSAASATSYECRVVRATEITPPWAACDSPETFDLDGVDGVYTFSVRALDALGNPSTAVSDTYVLDVTAPIAPDVVTKPGAQTNDDTPAFAFTGEADATFSCRISREGTALAGWAACPASYTPDISSQLDGAFALRVRAVDVAGNPGAEAEATFTLDRAAPDPAAFTGGAGARGNDASPSWTISVPAGASGAECRLDLDADEVADWGACSSPVLFALVDDGAYTVGLRARDAAGNRSTPVTRAYTLDRVGPALPVIAGAPATAGSGTSPSWSFSGEASSFECSVTRGATEIAGWAACTDPYSVSLVGKPNGTYTFSVRAVDQAGNTGDAASATYALDRTAPSFSGRPGATGNDETPTWTFAATGAASIECRISHANESAPGWATCASPRTFDLTERPDGVYTFEARAIDAGGDPSAVVSDTYDLDTAGPSAPAVTGQPSGVGRSDSLTWSWTGDGTGYECRLERDGAPTEAWATCASPRRLELAGAPDGTYRLGIRGFDGVGNAVAVLSAQYLLDRTPPTPPAYSAAPAPTGNGAVPSWSFASDPGVAYECQLERNGAVVEGYAPCASPRSYDLAGRPDGSYVLLVRASDGAGNAAVSPSAPYAVDRSGPDAARVTSGPGAVGNDVTPTWKFGSNGAAGFECGLFQGENPLVALGSCGESWTFDLTGEDDGKYTFHVRGLDGVGNATVTVEDDYVLDTEAPKPPEIRGDEEAEGDDEHPTWRFGGEDGTILECQLRRGDDVISRMDTCATPRSYDLSKADDGTYTFTVRATDAAGNVGRGATASYRLRRERSEAVQAAGPAAESPAAPGPAADPAPGAAPSASVPEATPAAVAAAKARKRAAAQRAAKRQAATTAAAAARRAASPDAAASPATSGREGERKKKTGLAGAAQKLGEVGKVVAEAVGVAAEKSAFPGLLLAFCGLFLVVQDRIDRRDPKLALAPIDADPELEFLPLDDLAADDSWKTPPCPA